MHKKIKHIIAVSLIIGAISCALPANHFVLGSTIANASTFKNASNGELSSLTIKRSTGSEIKLRDTYAGDEVSLSGEKEYYVELTGADGFEVSAEVQGSGYVAKVFTSLAKTEKGKDIGDYIKVDSTYNDIYVRTYKSEQAYEEAYNNGNVTNCSKVYVIHVKKPTVISEAEEFADHAYLKSIFLSDGRIDFSKDQTVYNVQVGDNTQEIIVRATPDDDEYLVSINDYSVDKDNDYEQTIKLVDGVNTIKIYVESDDENKTYVLNVYKGIKAPSGNLSGSENSTSGTQNFEIKLDGRGFNSWQRFDGKWKYIDGTGEALKNQWWFDRNTGKNYYLDKDGYMVTGWFNNNNKWYYFNESGEMQTGWVCLNKNWYYLNKSGEMKNGWLEDSTGNWYYLDGSGAMKTGWIEDSNGKWYYLDSAGKMIKEYSN